MGMVPLARLSPILSVSHAYSEAATYDHRAFCSCRLYSCSSVGPKRYLDRWVDRERWVVGGGRRAAGGGRRAAGGWVGHGRLLPHSPFLERRASSLGRVAIEQKLPALRRDTAHDRARRHTHRAHRVDSLWSWWWCVGRGGGCVRGQGGGAVWSRAQRLPIPHSPLRESSHTRTQEKRAAAVAEAASRWSGIAASIAASSIRHSIEQYGGMQGACSSRPSVWINTEKSTPLEQAALLPTLDRPFSMG